MAIIQPAQLILDLSLRPPTPDDQRCSDLEKQYLHFLYTANPSCILVSPFGETQKVWTHDLLIPAELLSYPIRSNALKYVALTFASLRKLGLPSPDTLQYVTQSCKYTNEAISASQFVDVSYATYGLTIISIELREPIETILSHFTAFGLVMQKVQYVMTETECSWLQEMWVKCIGKIDAKWCREPLIESEEVASRYAKITTSIKRQSDLLYINIRLQGMTKKFIRGRMEILAVYLHYYFCDYLFIISQPIGQPDNEYAETAIKSLRYLVRYILNLTDQVQLLEVIKNSETSFDSTVRSSDQKDFIRIIFSAILIDSILLRQASNQTYLLATATALRLCQFYTQNSTSQFAFEGGILLLAGLVLTKRLHPNGKRIIKYHEC